MNLVTFVHRTQQVLAHLLAVGRQGLARLGLASAVGAEGDAHLRTLGATTRARRTFAAAHPADQASAARTAASLRRLGAHVDDQLAALLHDLPKGRVALLPRVVHVLEGSPTTGRARGPFASPRQTLRSHAAAAPVLAAKLGAPTGTITFLRVLARIESANARPTETSKLGARVQLLLDIDSGVSR